MKHDRTMRIESMEDVAAFARSVIRDGVNYHPDTDFLDYVNIEKGGATYTLEEASALNKNNGKAFGLCRKQDVDIYEFLLPVFLEETGLFHCEAFGQKRAGINKRRAEIRRNLNKRG